MKAGDFVCLAYGSGNRDQRKFENPDVYDIARDHPAFRNIPVLFVTANPELALHTLPGAAPRDVLAKPFDLDDLVARAHSLLVEALAA